MPDLYDLCIQFNESIINFNNENDKHPDTKKYKKLPIIKELIRIAQDSLYSPESKNINYIFDAAIYFNSSSIILKRLTYHARKKVSLEKLRPEIQAGVFSYSIEELFDEKFFDVNNIVKIQHVETGRGTQAGVVLYETHYYNPYLDLSDYNIGSLVGLCNLKEKIKAHRIKIKEHIEKGQTKDGYTPTKITITNGYTQAKEIYKIKLNKNVLTDNSLGIISSFHQHFPRLKVLKLKKNQFTQFNPTFNPKNTMVGSYLFLVSLNNNNLKKLPQYQNCNKQLIFKIKNNPLTIRNRYIARSGSRLRDVFLSPLIGLSIALGINAGAKLLYRSFLHNYVSLAPSHEEAIKEWGTYPLGAFFLYGLFNKFSFSPSITPPIYKVSRPSTYTESFYEFLEDILNINYDLFIGNPKKICSYFLTKIMRAKHSQ